jgi:hypothetical protein
VVSNFATRAASSSVRWKAGLRDLDRRQPGHAHLVGQGLALARQLVLLALDPLGEFEHALFDVGGVEEREVGLDLGPPGGYVLADRHAAGRAPRLTVLLHEIDAPPQAVRGVATGVADQHPAHRVGRRAELDAVLVHLGGVAPDDLEVHRAAFGLQSPDAELPFAEAGYPGEHRAGLEPFLAVVPGEQPLHRRGVALPPEVPLASQDALRLLAAHHLDQVAPKLPQRMQVVQDEPAVVQGHAALAELHQLREVQVPPLSSRTRSHFERRATIPRGSPRQPGTWNIGTR